MKLRPNRAKTSSNNRGWSTAGRLAAKCRQGPGGCLLWNGGGKKRYWYGRMRVNGRSENTHRIAWELANGPVPDGLFVLHKCDVSFCCNPQHLFIGTQADNRADCVRKGRAAAGATHGSKTRPDSLRRGEQSATSLLTENDVRAIRRLTGTVSRQELAATFSVSASCIDAVVFRRNWKHVD